MFSFINYANFNIPTQFAYMLKRGERFPTLRFARPISWTSRWKWTIFYCIGGGTVGEPIETGNKKT